MAVNFFLRDASDDLTCRIDPLELSRPVTLICDLPLAHIASRGGTNEIYTLLKLVIQNSISPVVYLSEPKFTNTVKGQPLPPNRRVNHFAQHGAPRHVIPSVSFLVCVRDSIFSSSLPLP